MRNLFRKVFGLKSKLPRSVSIRSDPSSPNSKKNEMLYESGQLRPSEYPQTTNRYFFFLGKFNEAVRSRNYQDAIEWAKKSLPEIPDLIAETKRSHGRFIIQSIPVIEVGGTLMAVFGDYSGIIDIRKTIESLPDLEAWKRTLEKHEKDATMVDSILRVVKERPGVLQFMIKILISADDGRRPSTLIEWLEKAGKIKREKEGGSYKLTLVEASSERKIKPRVKPSVRSHRKDKNGPKIREINLKSMPYFPLPRAPHFWEEKGSPVWEPDTEQQNHFILLEEAKDLKIDRVEALAYEKRPDIALRKMYPIDSGIFMIDDLKAAVAKYGCHGELIAKRNLPHDIYRIGVNPLGQGMIAMSKDCILHGYNEKLELTLETTLTEAPETKSALKRSGFDSRELRYLVRCVAISRDNSCYLFTIVDEAWCISVEGRVLWGINLPLKDGWIKLPKSSDRSGNSTQIQEALSLMQLDYPVSLEDVKRQYRRLAKKWHPDLNPGDHSASVRMQRLIAAAELLTGVDIHSLSGMENEEHMKVVHQSDSFLFGYQLTPLDAYEWIYAAHFAGLTDKVLIGSYSGRIIVLNREGKELFMYDVGTVPRFLADNGDYLYILTNTRLYVLNGTSVVSSVKCRIASVVPAGE